MNESSEMTVMANPKHLVRARELSYHVTYTVRSFWLHAIAKLPVENDLQLHGKTGNQSLLSQDHSMMKNSAPRFCMVGMSSLLRSSSHRGSRLPHPTDMKAMPNEILAKRTLKIRYRQVFTTCQNLQPPWPQVFSMTLNREAIFQQLPPCQPIDSQRCSRSPH